MKKTSSSSPSASPPDSAGARRDAAGCPAAAGRTRQATAARRSACLTQSAGVSINAVRSMIIRVVTLGVLIARIVAEATVSSLPLFSFLVSASKHSAHFTSSVLHGLIDVLRPLYPELFMVIGLSVYRCVAAGVKPKAGCEKWWSSVGLSCTKPFYFFQFSS